MSASQQYLTFRLCGEEHAVPVLAVREIIEYEPVTRVPGVPAHVRGVINLRGAVLPVVDLATRLGQPPTAPTRTTCIVVVETRLGVGSADGRQDSRRDETVAVGVIADAVSQVVDLPAEAIEPPPAFGSAAPAELLAGMGKWNGTLLLLLDIDRVLAPTASELGGLASLDAVASASPDAAPAA